jgi:hypothetical protein
MSYSRTIWLTAIGVGIVYSLGYLSERLRYTIDDQVPLIGPIVLFICGACVGMYAACLFAPASFLATSQGRTWMQALSGVGRANRFRSVCFGVLTFFLLATSLVLWYAFAFVRD